MDFSKQEQDIDIHIAKKLNNPAVSIPKLKKLVKAICNRFKLSNATVSIAVVGDAETRKLNKQFLKHNCSTDVMSFNLSDEKRKLFEIIVNGEMAIREAKQRSHSDEAELALYVTHGLLHNLGFDDSTQSQGKKMHGMEDEILQELGYGLIYNKKTGA